MNKLQKHQHVTYRAWEGVGAPISAIVCRVHRDGTATIEACHFLKDDGSVYAGYLGDRYRLPQRRLRPVCP